MGELESFRLGSDTNLRAVKSSLALTETSTLESIWVPVLVDNVAVFSKLRTSLAS